MHPLHNSHLPGYEFDVNAGSTLLDEIGWVDDDNNLTTPRIYQGEDAHISPGTALSFPLFMLIKLAVTRPDMCGFIMDPSADSEMWNIENFDYGLACSNN